MKPVLLLSALVLAGCAVGPDFRRPEVALETRFVGGDAAGIGAVAHQAWRQDYRDPVLSDLVARGLAQGLDVMAANERLREAEANLRATGDSALSGSLAAAQTRAGGDGLVNTDTASASLGAAYVLDLFGGVRRAREGARADVVSARAAEETTRLAFLAELVAAYSDARYYQEALALSRQTIAARAETVEITRRQFAAGAATEYELAQAEALLQTARADLPQYAAQFDARVFAIATLLAEPSGPLRTRLQRGAPQLRIPGGSRTGVPADLLRNRPDVRGAEADLASAVAAVGVAEADLYPALTLSGTLARANGADTWSFGPGLSLPVLSQGSLRGARDAAVSRARQAEIDWRAAILAAVEDVTVARSNLDRYRQRAAALRRAADSYDRALKLAQANYRNGAITLLDLLETDRSAASARIAAASGVNEAAKAWASLRIATGAGAAVAAGG